MKTINHLAVKGFYSFITGKTYANKGLRTIAENKVQREIAEFEEWNAKKEAERKAEAKKRGAAWCKYVTDKIRANRPLPLDIAVIALNRSLNRAKLNYIKHH